MNGSKYNITGKAEVFIPDNLRVKNEDKGEYI